MKKIIHQRKIILVFCLCGLVASVNLVFAAMSSDNYQIWADVISVGGAEDMASDNYQLQDTIGEPIIGRSFSPSEELMGAGFREVLRVLTLSLSANNLNFAQLRNHITQTANHNLTVKTNSLTGISVTFTGDTLRSGSGVINGIGSTAAAAVAGDSQFGFNVIYQSGSAPVATAKAPYNIDGLYAFQSGDEIISSAGTINATVFTVNYIANITGSEPSGNYTTTINYLATANF